MPVARPLVCASASVEQLDEVWELASAVALHHGGERLALLLADAPETPAEAWVAEVDREAPFELVRASELPVSPSELHELGLCRVGDDLAACLSPVLVQHLLARGRPVVCLAPDVVVLGPLDWLGDEAERAGVVLVPRLLGPLPDDGLEPGGEQLAALGPYDPGIVAVAPSAAAFAQGWARALRDAASTERAGLRRADPWLAVAATTYRVGVARDPGYGVAWWNAHERRLRPGERRSGPARPEGTFGRGDEAAGRPLRLVHLEGFDPSTPALLAPSVRGRPRVRLSAEPVLARLCAERAVSLAARAGRLASPPAYRRLADGAPVDERMRRLGRRALSVRAGPAAAPEPSGREPTGGVPDPFDQEGPRAFYDWLASGDPLASEAPTVPRYLREVWADRPDLRWHFPRLGTVDLSRFREWAEVHGLAEEAVAPGLAAALARSSWWAAPRGLAVAPPHELRDGVVLLGYLRAESGVGEAARLVLAVLADAGARPSAVVLGSTPSRQGHPFELSGATGAPAAEVAGSAPGAGVARADRRINLLWVNADQLPGLASVAGPELFDGRYNVGAWAWETDRLPAAMASSAQLLDEVWVPSTYVLRAVEPVVDRPVHVVGHPVVAPPVDPSFDPASLGVPGGFRFVFSFDFLSSFVRKNPLGVLEAFSRAFSEAEGPVLVLKAVNGDKRPAELERLLLAAAGRRDVVVLDRYLTPAARGALLANCDCYVSLHRSEGFGLGIAEAIALGKPVIVTGYGGCLDIVDEKSAYVVPASRVPVGPGAAPYDPGDTWGEPDLAAAAAAMRRVVEAPGEARRIAELGRERVLADHGPLAVARVLRRRLDEIEARLRKGYVSGAGGAARRLL